MKKFRFPISWLPFVIGMMALTFNSCDNDKKNGDVSGPPTSDKGVTINGVTWATRNVDKPGTFAAKTESVGMFYQWNRNVAYPTTGVATDWDATVPEGDTWSAANDPCPDGWRVPTLDEINTLLNTDMVSNKWTTVNGITGRRFTDIATGSSLFLPAAGCRDTTGITPAGAAGSIGDYWSSTLKTIGGNAYTLSLSSAYAIRYSSDLRNGFSVHCVAEEVVPEP